MQRAYEQDPDAVERWKRKTFPAIRSAAEADGATVYFVDEAGIRTDYHAGKTIVDTIRNGQPEVEGQPDGGQR